MVLRIEVFLDILNVIAQKLGELIEGERFAQLSGFLGNNQYVFAKEYTIAECRFVSLLIPYWSDSPNKLVLMVRVKLDHSRVYVSSRISTNTLVTRHDAWYNERQFDCGDPDLFDLIVQHVKQQGGRL